MGCAIPTSGTTTASRSASRRIDLIIDHMGLDTDVDRARVASHLAPLLEELDRIADKRPDPARHAAMADRVVAALRNDDDRRRPFEARYLDVDGDRLVHRVREFRLVYDQFHPEGGTVLRLSNEAVNLFLGALELPIEDAQAAAEAIVQSQLARGRSTRALESAQRAHLQSDPLQGQAGARAARHPARRHQPGLAGGGAAPAGRGARARVVALAGRADHRQHPRPSGSTCSRTATRAESSSRGSARSRASACYCTPRCRRR